MKCSQSVISARFVAFDFNPCLGTLHVYFDIIAERLSARQLIVQYYLALRLYIYLSVTVWNAIYYRGLARTEFPVTPMMMLATAAWRMPSRARVSSAMCRSVVLPNLDILAQ